MPISSYAGETFVIIIPERTSSEKRYLHVSFHEKPDLEKCKNKISQLAKFSRFFFINLDLSKLRNDVNVF